MKKLIPPLIAALCLLVFAFPAAAYESSCEEELARDTGADKIVSESSDTGGVFDIVVSSVKGAYQNVLRFFCTLLCAVLLSALLAAFASVNGGAPGTAYSLVSVIAISGTAFSGLSGLFEYVALSITRLCEYMTALIPVTASLCVAGGNSFTGIAASSSLMLFLTLAQRFSAFYLFPLFKTGFAVSVAGSLPGSADLRPAAGFLKSALTFLLTLTFTLFGAVMYFQTVIGAAADNCAFRTVKFAAGAFIPVIGTMIGDAARTVTTAVGTVKAAVGGAGLVAVAAITLPAVIMTAAYKLCVLAAAAFAKMLGLEKGAGMLYDINGLLGLLLALLAGTAVIFTIAVALFIRIGVGE